MGLTLDISGSQINGARDYQEDAFLISGLGENSSGNDAASLVIVADGMGGHAAGNVASNLAVQTFNKYVGSHYPTHAIPPMLKEAARAANNSISETVRETPALRGMGCTLVAAVVVGRNLHWISIGDSHLYLLRGRELEKKNLCHSYGGFLDRMAAAGRPIEPETGFSRNMLMSALSGDEIAEIDCPETPLELQPGDRVIVSSDGLDSINAAKILTYSDAARSAKDFVNSLLKGVDEAAIPRQDNTTVVVIDVPGRPATGAVMAARADAVPVLNEAVVLESEAASSAAAFKPPPAKAGRPAKRKPRRDLRDAYVRPRRGLGVLILLLIAGAAGAAYYFRDRLMANTTVATLIETLLPSGPAPTMTPEELEAGTAPSETPVETTPAPEVTTTAPEPAEPVATEPTPVTAAPPAPIEEFRDALRGGGEGPVVVWVAAGQFGMGSSSAWPEISERPRHNVTLKKFAISRHEITMAEYGRFREAPNPFGLDGATHPVVEVSWNDAVAYAQWLSQQTGKTYRLATEAEWEYAAAAGTDPQYWPWGNQAGAGHAHCFGCAPDLRPIKPTAVGSFPANAFGLFDTAGNVAEWVADCYHPNYEGAPADGSAWEGPACSERVVRGGSYQSPPKSIRSARRDKWPAGSGHDSIGFRVVRKE
ncbi:MAG: SUMF1/EgtB/PvdO family nonheme iron enzyme [Chromatiales bacterium]